jgi:hypothetical protein
VENYHKAQRIIEVIMEHPRITINVRWEAPPVPWHIINTDGAVQHGVAGCGGVLRDHQGAWIGWY